MAGLLTAIGMLLSFAGDPINLNGAFLTSGIQTIRLFDPDTQSYRVVNTMERGRWYPSVTIMADGNLLIVGGMQQVITRAVLDMNHQTIIPDTM